MKWLFFTIFLIIPSLASSKIYYVAPKGGSDSNTGTDINNPWATWSKAFTSTPSGDTCYFRGGTWYSSFTVTVGSSMSGTYSHPTCFFAYPADFATGNKPILDLSGWIYGGSSFTTVGGLTIASNTHHIYFKGLTICHFEQHGKSVGNHMVYANNTSGNIKYDQCVLHHSGGVGFYSENCDTILYYNCDAWEMCDTISADPGGWATGFAVRNCINQDANAQNTYVYYKGCRAWRCSDQGWGGASDGTVKWDSCWSLHNGFHWGDWEIDEGGHYGYNGNGAKWEEAWEFRTDTITRIMQNCVFAFNEYIGIAENNYISDQHSRCRIQNNFLYSNGYAHYAGVLPNFRYNFDIANEADNTNIWDRYYSNNISYKSGWVPAYDSDGDRGRVANEGTEFISQTNYWNSNTSVTDADFVTLDSTGMCGPRQADGTLPYTLFGHLAPGSNLIDAGTDVGLSYKGSRPDVGWVESQPGSNMYPSVNITSPANNSKFTPPATVNITVNALDGDGTISKVEFFSGTTKLGEKTSNPWSFTWNEVPMGTYSLTAVAYDNLGAKTTSSAVSITVGNSTVANKPPAITILNPVTGSTFTAPAAIAITANASDADGTISKVEFFNGVTLLGEKTSNPWSFTWDNVPIGTYSFTAAATDNTGARTTSSAVTIIVNNLPPATNQPPVITISNPVKGKIFKKPASITIDAVASDPDGTISKVEFFNGNTELAELTTAPWSYTWKDVDVGTYLIKAVATDNLNATTISSSVDVVVEEDITTSFYDVNSEIINLYPNPNDGSFTIELIDPLNAEKSKITITSFEGKVIYNGTMLQEEIIKHIDLSYINPGFYILILSRNEIIVTKKFIKK